ncbi:MAG: T9SS type A sorting domain-containing protein [Bacteroidetes bacterium]|nr:T9SS type A sorting domain-containing protein [Bacteroidota bacterium]
MEGRVELTDISGIIVFHSRIDSSSDMPTINLNVASGIYLVRAYSDGHSIQSKKIIVE